jgi:predicted RNA-binding protein associated with RNAse of E/G family
MTVVRDDADVLVAWLQAGTPSLVNVRADGRPLRADKATMFTTEQVQVERPWAEHHNLRIHQPGRWWSTWVFFDGETGAFEGWYCNIEDPHVRDDRATYSRDHVLDVWVEPDRAVERKDEDELLLAVEQGRYTEQQAARITAVAEEIEDVVRRWGPPFCDGWETFRPDPAWPVPGL